MVEHAVLSLALESISASDAPTPLLRKRLLYFSAHEFTSLLERHPLKRSLVLTNSSELGLARFIERLRRERKRTRTAAGNNRRAGRTRRKRRNGRRDGGGRERRR
jgi:hypothetical protein